MAYNRMDWIITKVKQLAKGLNTAIDTIAEHDDAIAEQGDAITELESTVTNIECKVIDIYIPAGETFSFSADHGTGILWNTLSVAAVCGFRNNVASKLFEGDDAHLISLAADGTTYTITNDSTIYLRGFIRVKN